MLLWNGLPTLVWLIPRGLLHVLRLRYVGDGLDAKAGMVEAVLEDIGFVYAALTEWCCRSRRRALQRGISRICEDIP